MSSSKNTGFVIDFGGSDPFDHEGAIMGGADRPITVVAKHPGRYTYSVGACTAGTIYGMCGNADTQLIFSANQLSTHAPAIASTRNSQAMTVCGSHFLSPEGYPGLFCVMERYCRGEDFHAELFLAKTQYSASSRL